MPCAETSASAGQADRHRADLGRAAVADFEPITIDPARRPRQLEAARGRRARDCSASKQRLDKHGLAGLKAGRDHDRRARPRRCACSPTTCCSTAARPSLKPTAQPLLAAVAGFVARRSARSNNVRVEGNTDNIPISNAAFRSNWELSAARATAVLESLLQHGIAARRLSATAYADQRPLATNGSAHGRSTNRRVELVVLRRAVSGLEGATP